MHRRIKYAVVAAVAAVAMAAGLGLTGETSALAGSAKVISGSSATHAGFVLGMPHGWHFRFVYTFLNVPACVGGSGNEYAQVGLDSYTEANVAAYAAVTCGGGAGSVKWVDTYVDTNKHIFDRLAPAVGDQLRISVYYNQWGNDEHRAHIAVADLTKGIEQVARVYAPRGMLYTHASLEAGITSIPNPSQDVLLWHFRNIHATSYEGTVGILYQPWGALRNTCIRDGRVVMDVLDRNEGFNFKNNFLLWHNGFTFSVRLRAAS